MLLQWIKKLWQEREVKSFAVLLILIAVVLSVCPFLAENNPLSDVNNRLLVIFAITLVWGVINWWQLGKSKHRLAQSHRDENEDALYIACENIRENVEKAVAFLKQRLANSLAGYRAFQRMPWYLVIGNNNAGKTQLLSRSELEFLETEKFVQITPEGMTTANSVNWWFAPSAVLLDVPGNYLDNQKQLSPARAAWMELLRQLRRVRWRQPINGVVIVIDVETLLRATQDNEQSLLLIFRARLEEIVHRLKQRFPVYIVCSQVDKIQGFAEYFDDMGKSERSQNLGITFPLQTKTTWAEYFSQEFESFIQNLHQRVLWRLHHEREALKRNAILQFPQQLHFLKDNLHRVIYDLSNLSSQIALRGVYFTSAILQDQATVDHISENVSKQFALLPVQQGNVAPRMQQAFFVKELFEQRIFPEAMLANDTLRAAVSRQDHIVRFSALAVAGIILISVAFTWSQHYQKQTLHLNIANTALSDYKLLTLTYNPATTSLDKLLPILNALALAKENAEQANLPWLLRFQLHHQQPLAVSLEALYQHDLQTMLIPTLRLDLAQQLQAGEISDPSVLYGLFKTYLMLGDPQHDDSNYLKHWFNTAWQDPHAKNPQLQQHLAVALSASMPTLAVDQSVVTPIRITLNALSYPVLSNAIFHNELPTNMLQPLAPDSMKHTFILPPNGVPQVYTVEQLTTVDQQITNALSDAIDGNWVLGSKSTANISAATVEAWRATLINSYAIDYSNAWQEWLNQIQLKPFHSLTDLDWALQELTSNSSPLASILQTIAKNADMSSSRNEDAVLVTALENNLMPHFAALLALLEPTTEPTIVHLRDVITALQQLQFQVHHIISAKDPGQTALTLMQQNAANISNNPIAQLMQLAKKTPPPISGWLNSIAVSGRDLMMQEARDYVQQQWQQQVLPQCLANIVNHYPIQKSADRDIRLSDFQQFFASSGAMNQFFQKNLAPFVDTTQAKWQWRNINGSYFATDVNVLAQFERDSIVQKLYFASNGTLRANYQWQLSGLAPNVQSAQIQVGDKTYSSAVTESDSESFVWPGSSNNTAAITIVDTNGDKHTITTTGAWALFRLLDAAQVKPNADGQSYAVSFSIEGYQANYLLTAASPLNPFIPGIIDQFSCPSFGSH